MTRVSAARQPFELEAAMLNLRLATAMAGHQPTVTLLPGGPRSDAVAVVRRVHGVIYRRSNARCSPRSRPCRPDIAGRPPRPRRTVHLQVGLALQWLVLTAQSWASVGGPWLGLPIW
jgi:hypothetical protein